MAEVAVAVWNFAAAAFSGTAFGTAQAGTALAVANAGAQFAANVTLALAVNSVVANNTKPKDQGGLIDLTLDSAAPRRLVIGKRMTGGVLVDWYLAGNNNTKLYLPVYLSEGPCGQITRVFAGGREVWSTPLVHGVRTTIPDFRSGGDRLWLTYYDGRAGQTADPALVALSQGWGSDNTMEGCAYVVIECQWDSDNLRAPPQLTFEMEGAKLYDRRLDGTAGGTGSHRIDNPATWAWSDNPMVALDHFLLGRYLGGRRTFGIGLSADEVPYDRFAAQANICDEDVDLKAGGTQKRYRANGIVFASDDYANTITQFCTAMAARPADFGGRFGVIGIESRSPVLTIDDGDLIADGVETYTPKRSWSNLVGAVEGRYQDPAQLYQPVDFPRVTDAAWEAEDGGEPKVLTLELDFETNVERAQRLALLKARAERRQATLKGVYPLWAIELERGDWFVRTGAKWGEDGKTFEVIERILNTENFTVSIVAQEVDATDSAWDESTAQDGPPAPVASTDEISAVTAPVLTVTSNPIVGASSNTPAIKVAFTNPTDPRVHTLFIEVVRDSDGLKVATLPVSIPDADEEVIVQNGIAEDVDYTVQAKFLTSGLQSAWSDPEAVTTGATYSAGPATSVPWSGVTDSGGKPDDNADVTASNTAAAITGQGAFATLNNAAYGSAYLTGFAALAAKATIDNSALMGAGVVVYTALSATAVRLGTNITRNDGTTSLTDALAVTSLGTAAAITSQGALATLGQVNLGASGRVYRDDGTTRLTDALAVTALGTAAAITGQGAGATANDLAGLNATDGASLAASLSATKSLFVRDFTADDRHWTTDFGGTPDSVAAPVADGYFDVAGIGRVIRITPSEYLQPKAVVKPIAGRRYLLVVRLRAQTNPSSGAINVGLDINGLSSAYAHGNGTFSTATPVNAISSKSALVTADGWVTLAQVFTAGTPSTYDAYWRFRASLTQTGTGGKVEVAFFDVIDVTDIPVGRALSELFRADGSTALTDSTVITSLGTAGGFTGQGALATLSSLAYGGAYLTGFAALAAKATIDSSALVGAGVIAYTALTSTAVRLGTNITRNDGTTSLTDALAVTSLGTAAAITSQGSFATLSQTYFGDGLLKETSGGTTATLANFKTSSGTAAAISGQGGLATLSFVTISTNLRLADGTTVATTAMVVTASGTAAAIASQGDLATRNQAALPFGENALVNSTWRKGTLGWQAGWSGNSAIFATHASGLNNSTSEARNYWRATLTGTPANGTVFDVCCSAGSYLATDLANSKLFGLPVLPGDVVYAGGKVSTTNCSVQAVVIWIDATGVVISSPGVGSSVSASTGGLGNFQNYSTTGGVATAPANARFAAVFFRATNNGSADPVAVVIDPILCLVPAGQTAAVRYTPGPPDPVADQTSSNTAAAITGQGNMATGNSYYQSSDPGGANGDFWGDTTNGLLKYKTGGSWVTIGDIGGQLKLSIGSAINVIGSSGFSGNIAVTATGGDGTYTYLWSKMPYEAGVAATLTNTSTATVGVSASLSTGQDSTGRVQCVVRDGKGRTASISQSYNFSKTS